MNMCKFSSSAARALVQRQRTHLSQSSSSLSVLSNNNAFSKHFTPAKTPTHPSQRSLMTATPDAPFKISFTGAPGSGKGTFATKVAPHFGIPFISTGDLIREEIANKSEIGVKVQSIIEKGDLVGDDIMNDMVADRLARPDCANGYLLDGFPRKISQAEMLDTLDTLDVVLNVDLREDLLIEKAISRRNCGDCGKGYNLAFFDEPEDGIYMPPLLPKEEGVCDKCGGGLVQRSDDKEHIVKDRIENYKRATKPLLGYYSERELLVNFQVKKGIQDMDRVIATLEEVYTQKTATLTSASA